MENDADLARENAALRARVAELEGRIEWLEQLADSDTLTPLPNRRFFVREVARAIAQLQRYDTPSALLFVDLNRLKEINDAHGHAAGDRALVQVAAALRDNVRTGDTVARIGGDEFGVLLDHADEAGAREKAAALGQALASAGLGVAIGLTPLHPTDNPEAALARADTDMYRAKRAR